MTLYDCQDFCMIDSPVGLDFNLASRPFKLIQYLLPPLLAINRSFHKFQV